MKSFVAPLLAACLVLTACGGSTAESVESASSQDDAAATTVAETTTVVAETTTEAPAADEPADGDNAVKASSIDDIPEVCRELMADFLREIEPVVSGVDWDNATMADFEAISLEFEPIADDFDASTEAEEECDDIELEDDENFALLIEFAGDEAPGAVGFLTFLNDLLASFEGAIDTTTGEGTLTTCDDAIAFVQGLVDNNDSFETVPLDQLAQMAELSTAMFACSPEELEFFNSPEISEFLAGA